jgi:nicotinate dehydrogenase subunit B
LAELPDNLARHPEIDRWLAVRADGKIVVRTGKVEIGQGIRTALAAIAAEELEVSMGRIVVETAHTGRTPNEFITAGSRSIEDSGRAIRYVAAAVRAILLERAAGELGVDVGALSVADGVVSGAGANRTVSYWELQGGREFATRLDAIPVTRSPDAYTVVGRRLARIDLPAKVFGGGAFLHDLRPPGLVHARVVRAQAPGARLQRADLDGFTADGLVATVIRGSFVAVAAEREEQAVAAALRLRGRLRWSTPPLTPSAEVVHDWLDRRVTADLLVVNGTPTDDAVPPPLAGDDVLEARFSRPYQMHGSLGPSAALAHHVDGHLRVWSHSQGPELLKRALADVVGIDAACIEVIHSEGAGCYGHNGADDAACDAALVALAIPGRPVLLQWSRTDEHRFEPYAPPMRITLRARHDSERITTWDQEIVSLSHSGRPHPVKGHSNFLAAGELDPPLPRIPPRPARTAHAGIHRNGDPLYAFATRRIVKRFVPGGPLRASSTRGLGALANVFAIECFMDEIAGNIGADPLAFRLRHLSDPRAIAVLKRLRAMLPASRSGPFHGRGVGFAQYKNAQTYCAVAVDVAIDDAPIAIRLERAWIVADAGLAIDPDGLVNQLEGGFVQAASWTLREAVTWDEGGVTSVDWNSYPILGFADVPRIETLVLDRRECPPLGAGEASVGPAAAAIGNAIAAASGVRLRDLPLTAEKLIAALA